jgi:acetylornithine aminotransferase
MICDEVQTGIFRTGTPYAFQHFGVMPDIVSMAKGIASGLVAGACAARASVADAFAPGDHGTTFGGSNIAITAAYTTLMTLLDQGFATHIEEVGAYLRARLAELPHVQEVRGMGLMAGLDLTHEAPAASEVVNAGLGAGLVLNATGPHTMRFLPPLICEKEDVDVLIERLQPLL